MRGGHFRNRGKAKVVSLGGRTGLAGKPIPHHHLDHCKGATGVVTTAQNRGSRMYLSRRLTPSANARGMSFTGAADAARPARGSKAGPRNPAESLPSIA